MYGVKAKEMKSGAENVDRMLRRFKRVTEAAGLLAEVKKRRSFEKPSEEKRRKKNNAVRRTRQTASAPTRKRKRGL